MLATVPGGRCGHLTYFEGVLYVVARCAQQIYQVTLDGTTTLLAGSGVRGNDDGPALSASFNHPNGIEAKRDDDNIYIYVNDATSLSGDCLTVPLNPVVVRKITINPTSVEEITEINPTDFTLLQNYPNPFNPSTQIRFTIAQVSSSFSLSVKLIVYDLLGNEIATLINEDKPTGEYEVIWNGKNSDGIDVPSGTYFYSLRAGENFATRKMILLK